MSKLFKVGTYIDKFNRLTGQNLPLVDIMQSDGLVKHLQKRHPAYVTDIGKIPDIINHPDYIGSNPSEPDSIELIKVYSDNLQIAIKLDASQQYLYVASMYPISNGKLQNRLHSGRVKPFK